MAPWQGALKAVLVGGPTGGFLPPEALDTPLAYEALREAGALGGSGTLLALDESACIVDVATLMTRYLNDSACGKTIPCRIGTRRMAELGGAICSGHVRPGDSALLARPCRRRARRGPVRPRSRCLEPTAERDAILRP